MIMIEQSGKNLAKIADHGFINTIDATRYSDPLLFTRWAGGSTWQRLPNNGVFLDGAIAIRIPLTFFKNTNYTFSHQGDRINLWIASLKSDGNFKETLISKTTEDSITFSPYNYDVLRSEYIAIILDIDTVGNTATLTNLQLEEGSVATPYEDPWVNVLTFDDNLHTGEFLQKSKGIFYIHKTWYRDNNNNTYELLTFNNGIVTPTQLTSQPVIVEDVSTGEIKNTIVTNSQVNIYLNQYDSWTTTNSSTSSFNLSKVSLTEDYPIQINGTVTTSGFTQTTTYISFSSQVQSGSTVSCVYPYLDTSYNSQAKVFYQVSPTDNPILPNESKQSQLITSDNSIVTTTSSSYTTIKNLTLVQSKDLQYTELKGLVTLKTSQGTTYTRLNIDSGSIISNEIQITNTISSIQEITFDSLNLDVGIHNIQLEMHVDSVSNTATNDVFQLWGKLR